MDVEPISVTVDSGTDTPIAFPVVLKKIMEIPPPNLLEGDDGKCLCTSRAFMAAQLAVGARCIAEFLSSNAPCMLILTTDQESFPRYVNTESVFVLFITWFAARNVSRLQAQKTGWN